MKWSLSWLLLVACSSSTAEPSQPKPPDAGPLDAAADVPVVLDASGPGLSLMSWNLENFPLASETSQKVAGIVAEELPDLIAVQEIGDEAAFMALPQSLPAGYQAYAAAQPNAFLRAGVIFQTARVSAGQPELLFVTDTYAFPRPPLKVRVFAGSFDFDLVIVHLKAQIDAESIARRKDAIVKLEAWISARVASGEEEDVVVAGDFNDELNDAPSENVFLPFLNAPGSYRFLTSAPAAAGEHSYLPFQSMIDHVLVTSALFDEYGSGQTSVLHLDQTVPYYQDQVSDHRPVLSVFEAP